MVRLTRCAVAGAGVPVCGLGCARPGVGELVVESRTPAGGKRMGLRGGLGFGFTQGQVLYPRGLGPELGRATLGSSKGGSDLLGTCPRRGRLCPSGVAGVGWLLAVGAFEFLVAGV